jgi:hypothetical protein
MQPVVEPSSHGRKPASRKRLEAIQGPGTVIYETDALSEESKVSTNDNLNAHIPAHGSARVM